MATRPLELLARSFAERHPEDAARALEALPPADAAGVVRRLPARAAGAVVERLDAGAAAAILTQVGAEATHALIESVPSRQAASILRHLEEALRDATLAGMSERAARQIRDLLHYPPGTAGDMMEPRITTVPIDVTVGRAISMLRRAPRATLFYLYATDREGRLAGVLNTRELLLASPNDPIEPLVRKELVTVRATDDRETVADLVRRHHFVALPVVDADGRLVGVVRHDEVLGAIQEEAFQDLQKMVGAGEDERALSPVSVVIRKRLPWLYVNLATAFLAAAVVGLFEDTIQQVTALAVLLPVVAGQGGNTGAQALAVVMRGIALREIVPGSVRRVLLKETAGAFVNGTDVALRTALAVYAWDGRPALAAVIGLAMVVNMGAAGLSGAAIPLVLRALRRDPAQSSSIVLTTVTDVVGFAAFLGFAVAFMPYLQP